MKDALKYVELTKVEDDIGVIILNTPPENYLKSPEFIELKLLKKWIDENDFKALIITGKGRNFSAGADIKTISAYPENKSLFRKKLRKGHTLLEYIENLKIPVAAAVNGACFGGGLEVALSAHFLIAAENAHFSFPETELGIIPGLNGTIRLPGKIGRSKAVELILSGEIINTEKAEALGIVDHIAPKNEALEYSFKFLKKLTYGRSKELVAYVISSINNSKKMPLKKAMKKESEFFCRLALKEAKNLINTNNKN
jgi:enoyl-CoA hydratase/carnithine racemase